MKKRLSLLFVFAFIYANCIVADNDKLPQISITIDNGGRVSSSYSKGNIKIEDTDGTTVTLNAKIKTRGATAAEFSEKPSMNVKLRDDNGESIDSCLLGLRSCSKWILDAMAIDRICMRNRVAMDIWNDYSSIPYETSFGVKNQNGQTIYRSGTIGKYVEVSINGKYKGVYVLSDHINRKLLDLKKIAVKKTTPNDTIRGVLYKSGTISILDQNSPVFTDDYKTCVASWHNAWELKEPEDYECKEAWYPLLDAMGSSLASGDGVKVDSYELVKQFFYIENLVDYQLHVMALSIQDNWGNKNHYLSIRNIQKDINDANPEEANKRKFYLSPWDLDTAFGGHYKGDYYNGYYGLEWTLENVIKIGGCFPFPDCQSSKEYKELLQSRWQEVRETSFWPENVNKRLEAYRDLLVNSGAWERNETVQPRYVKDLEKEINYIEEWYARRFNMMDEYFGIADDVKDIVTDSQNQKNQESIFTIDGRHVSSLSKGMYIIRQADGTYRKVIR